MTQKEIQIYLIFLIKSVKDLASNFSKFEVDRHGWASILRHG